MESTQSSNPKKEHKSGVSLQPLLKSYNPYAKGYYTDAAGRFGVKSSGLIVRVKPHENSAISRMVQPAKRVLRRSTSSDLTKALVTGAFLFHRDCTAMHPVLFGCIAVPSSAIENFSPFGQNGSWKTPGISPNPAFHNPRGIISRTGDAPRFHWSIAMNQVAIDPKAVIERMTADALLAKKIGEVVKDPAKFLPRHRGFLTLMMTSGEIVSGVIKIATHQVLVFVKEGDIRTTRIEIGDIADFEI